ncbi:RUN and SH3 domain-containing protein 1 isoform X4 [Pygocentrus nattereri]|uniref:RUN and SH3 domain-containing protein 1 n=1 Tax=Pygocentrus nattereri TaxID=42514 RepID=A0A3B4CMW9_PYGNA|nr:RUN and SH3 domain-containing protein 1 isoform X4 [Pygocentrus nattereri]
MHSTRPSVPPRPRRFDGGRRTEAKPPNHVTRRDDKNSVNNNSSSPRRVTRGPPEPSRFKSVGQSPRSTVTQPKLVRQQKNSVQPASGNSKPKAGRAASSLDPAVVDPNCNEPSLPCLCCDGHSLQDSNSLFNHNHNNNNTVALRQQIKLAPSPHNDKEVEKKPEIGKKAKCKPEEKQPVAIPVAKQVDDREEENGNADKKNEDDHKEDDAGAKVNVIVDENGNGNNDVVAADDVVVDDDADDDEEDDDDDDNTLVPSCCDCPASMLDFSLTSSTSSSSTSISSCSDLESDCPDTFSVSLQEQEQEQEQELYPPPHSPVPNAFQPCSLPLDLSTSLRPPPFPCSPDEGYPSAPSSPSSDFMESKEPDEQKAIKVDLLNFLDSIDELGKVDRFYRIVQVAHWELEGDFDLRDRLVHQERLEKVNKQVKLIHLERLQEAGHDFDEEDLSGVLDEMGNIDISWKMYKSDKSCDSQEYSDAGVDMTAPSDLDEPPAADSLVPSPVEPPPRPPKPPARHISAQPELHTYMNISGNTPSVSSASSPVKSFSLSVSASPSSSSASKPPALPPPPSQPVPYFTLYSDSPSLPSPTPPIPPPRRRHKARLEAQRLAELEKEKTPQSLPAPTSRPPPLPPPPAIQPSPPAIPPPPTLPPPPSFHALDVEIRKLLALAGITQAELLRLSPELGVCVDGILEEGEISEISKTSKEEREDAGKVNDLTWRERNKLDVKDLDAVCKEDEKKQGSREPFRTTSFTEMARRRKRNGGSGNSSCGCVLGDDVSLNGDSYYSTDISNKELTNASFGSFDYASVIPDTPPPPPPPRPLPPRPQILSNPPELPPIKPCTLPANASRPDRFDWLIAFTPDMESPPLNIKKSSTDAMPQKTTGPKVTTFKELRNRSKQASPRAQVQPEPEPTVITPDPDFLYNLKWRREKADGDGTQWEYTSQAQATFLQPPPTPASLALFREMRHLNIQGGPSLEPSTIQRSTHLASRNDSCDFGGDWKGEQTEEDVEKTEVRGMADGERTWESRTRAVRSLSFAGSAAKGAWMGSDVRPPLRDGGLSSLCLQEKRALVSAVSVAVEAILAQFSSSRTLVQKFHSVEKALSGDSSVNPTLGRLVLQCLCPALRDLLSDGLKPHQSDLIAGRRPNSPWGLVQASTKPGPTTQALYSLQIKVAALPQLKHNRHRFNSFLLGLLNIKRLDFWLSRLQSCSDVLETYYRPTAFMRLSASSCQPLFEELLLLLQPLSLLTFNLDLLFQHHHLDPSSPDLTPASHSPGLSRPPNRGFSFHLLPTYQAEGSGGRLKSVSKQDVGGSVGLKASGCRMSPTSSFSPGPVQIQCRSVPAINKGETSPQLQWLKEKEIEAPPGDGNGNSLTQQAGQALQQGWGAVMRWGERLGQNLGGLTSIGSSEEAEGGPTVVNQNAHSTSDAQSPGQEALPADGVPWGLGRLFGASKSPNNLPSKRRPSQWLSPGITALTRMTGAGQAFLPEQIEPVRKGENEKVTNEEKDETGDQPKPLRAVRTLCDHTGTGAELSFRKGEELIVLGGVDQDWIRCRQGDKEGLVPIGYASLIM